ncbi:hypothetical protein [Limnoglobus roseus]|uniref:hypothetical protein n=1 Tax=Limnoglobus roseus TaxID=2598579 RepID=UPI0011EAE484|nr:hypothetical protein [Limnoglobus roseus]
MKQIEQQPSNYLGSRMVVEAWLHPELKSSGSTPELSVSADATSRATTRLRFLSPKSLADQVHAIDGIKPAMLTGTIAAPESSRAGYSFEVEEITFPNAEGSTTVLKPTAVVSTPTESSTPPPATAEPNTAPSKAKAAESGKKSDKVPTVLAGGLALFLAAALVVGLWLMKHMKARTPVARAASPKAD